MPLRSGPTDWAGRSLRQTPNCIAAYAETAGARLKGTADASGKQPGDPVRAAKAVIGITIVDHLVLGAFGINAVTAKHKASLAEIEQWRDTGLATDFPQVSPKDSA